MSDKTCETCKWWRECRYGSGMCHRFPSIAARKPSDWCGEWSESEVTYEQTLVTGFGTPAFKVTERQNGTSVTEPVPDETRDNLRRLKYENAELRELARALMRCTNEMIDIDEGIPPCGDCPLNMSCVDIAKELGVDE